VDYSNKTYIYTITFIGMKGFNLEKPLETNTIYQKVFIFNSMNFNFYNENQKLIKSCQDFKNKKLLKWHNFILSKKTLFLAEFRNLKYPSSICELVFKNANLNSIRFSGLINSYYKINLLKFKKQSDNFESLNSNIPVVEFDQFFEIDIDSSLLNENVFEQTSAISLLGKINSIQVDLFRNFQKINFISFHPVYFLEIVRKQVSIFFSLSSFKN